MKALKCPNCDGPLEVEDGLDMFYCKYCGYKIIMNEQSDAAYDAKVRIRELEHEERMLRQKQEHEKDENRNVEKSFIRLLIILVLFLAIFFVSEKLSSNREEKKLEQIVQEVQLDVKNKNFEDAYVKAKSIKYTSGWSDEIEEKWEQRRQDLLDYISAVEKKETGKTTYKKGFFEKLFGTMSN